MGNHQGMTAEQEAAVSNVSQNTLVIAGAGTGKTFCLQNAVTAAGKEKSLVITFTNKAANELKQRIGEHDNITVGTFHGIAWDLIKSKDLQIIDDSMQNDVLVELFYSGSRLGPEMKPRELLKSIGFDKSILAPVTRMRGIYDNYCDQYGYVDFGECIIKATAAVDEYYDNIFVDEFQDTDPAQLEFIRALVAFKKPSRLFCVGDPRQAIYGWRGASADANFDAVRLMSGTTEFQLTLNFRSDSSIVKKSNDITYHQNLLKLRAFSQSPGEVETFYCPNEAQYLAAACREKIMDGETSIAILFRTRQDIWQYENQLIRYCVRYNVWGAMRLTEYNLVKDGLAWLAICDSENPEHSLIVRAAKNIKGVGPKMAGEIADINGLGVGGRSKKEQLLLLFYNKIIEFKTIANFHLRVIAVIDFIKTPKTSRSVIRKFVDLARSYENTKDFINDVLIANETKKSTNGVVLSTVHKTKGLEFDWVYLPNATSKNYPLGNNKNILEENNVFYVGFTRARHGVYVSYSEGELTPFLKIV